MTRFASSIAAAVGDTVTCTNAPLVKVRADKAAGADVVCDVTSSGSAARWPGSAPSDAEISRAAW
jgi:hypothetical protein